MESAFTLTYIALREPKREIDKFLSSRAEVAFGSWFSFSSSLFVSLFGLALHALFV